MSREDIFLKWLRKKVCDFNRHLKMSNANELIGIGDDAAVVEMKDERILLKTDMTVRGIHFGVDTRDFSKIGHKAIARPLSDIAAMGGIPCFALLNLQAPRNISMQNIKKIVLALLKTASRYNTRLVGGDFCTVKDKNLSLQVSVIGKTRHLVTRSGAKVGDNIFVTGKLGGSILGKHLNFKPRIKEAQILCKKLKISAMIDISDGLVRDMYNIINESKCGTVLFEKNIPISENAKKLSKKDKKSPLFHALSDGEDYELLFTTSSSLKFVRKINLKLYFIGKIIRERGVFLEHRNGKSEKLGILGYSH